MKINALRFITALLLISALLCGLIACGTDNTETTPTQSESIGDTSTESSTEISSESVADTPTESVSASETEAVSNTQPDTDRESQSITESESVTQTQSESEPASETQSESVTETETESESVTESVTESESDAPEETTLPELTWETYDPALDNSTVDKSAEHTVDQSQWTATDGLDRVLPTNTQTGDVRDDKIVALFYWSWHGSFADDYYAYNNQQNINKLIEMGYTERDYVNMSVEELKALGIDTEMGVYHSWDEPIYGYYDGDDEWVIRKHAELLAAADVDVVFFDNTNGNFTWLDTAKTIMKVFSEARAEGVDAPAVSFMLPFGPFENSRNQIIQLYNNIYAQNYCSDIWFRLDEKPMLMAWGICLDINDPLQNQIYNFFDFRANMAGYLDTETAPDQWGWLSRFPQAFFRNSDGLIEQITVGTAMNHNFVDRVIATMSSVVNVIGRTWTSRGYDIRENALLYGACFAEQWKNALAVDPRVVFVTGWNEWGALRLESWAPGGTDLVYENCFVDQYNAEFSRDCEPTTGILKDHYYYQLADYIRQFKGTNAIEKATGEKLIDVNGGFGQWNDVGPTYNDYFGLSDRDFKGYIDPNTNQHLHYTNYTGRNDFYDAKVARDYENIYFMVRTVDDITPYTDDYWMRLYIDMGDSNKNWEGYEFILNKQNPDNESTATLEQFTGKGFNTRVVGKVTYSVQGNVMTVCIPKTMLGIPADQLDFEFSFKWTDNTCEDGDIMQWYVNGDTAPVGRWNYCYTTSGSEAYVERPDSHGKAYFDMTNEDTQQEIQKYLMGDTVNVSYEFTSDGLTLTSTDVGKNTEFILNLGNASPCVLLDRYKSVIITYKITEGSDVELRVAIGAGEDYPEAENSRSRVLVVTPEGDSYSGLARLRNLRATTGYANELGIFFDDNVPAGATVTITSIQFVE